MGTAEKIVDTIKSTLDGVIQELKRLSLEIDELSLADDTYRSGRDRSSINLPPPPPSSYPSEQPPPYRPSTNFPQPPLLYTLTSNNEFITCVVQRLHCNQKTPGTTQRHQNFYSRCSVKSKVCNLIINNKNCKNLVSRALMDYLKLETEPHHHPHTIG